MNANNIKHTLLVLTTISTLFDFQGSCFQDDAHRYFGPDSRLSRIVGGDDVQQGHWSWQVSLQFQPEGDTSGVTYHHCGGSILNDHWVISAGHCKKGAQMGTMVIYAGIRNIAGYYLWVYGETVDRNEHTLEEMNPYLQRLEPEKLLHFEKAKGLDGEVMLIKLKQPIRFNEMVSPISLPEQGDPSYLTPGKMCGSAGWGTTVFKGRYCPVKLQEIFFPLISRETCDEWFEFVENNPNNPNKEGEQREKRGHITNNMICAGYEDGGKSPCHADSGGPLVCSHGSDLELIGLTSWGYHCGAPKNPAVFVYVAPFVDWIKETMRNN